MSLVPFLLGEEIDREIGTEPVANIGEEEIGRIQRTTGACPFTVLARAHGRLGCGTHLAPHENGREPPRFQVSAESSNGR